MAIYIKIRKIKEKNFCYYYLVEDDSSNERFYICIDSSNKLVSFYATDNLSNPIAIVDFGRPTEKINVPGINNRTVFNVLLKVYRAIKDDNYPDILDYCA